MISRKIRTGAQRPMKIWIMTFTLMMSAWSVNSCGDAEKLANTVSSGGMMTLKGTVKDTQGQAISGAKIRIIKLLDLEAIQQLIEYKKIPDGAGGEKDIVRIKFDKVHAYTPDFETTTTDAGTFEQEVPLQLYLVYILGPGPEPGQKGSYTAAFWGINTETGELDLDNLIGKDLEIVQTNDGIALAGGPVPPPAPAPALPPPPPEPEISEAPPAEEPEPTVVDATRPEEIVRQEPAAGFWKSIELTFKGGSIGSGVDGKTLNTQADDAPLEDGMSYYKLRAELVTAQTDPVYLVMQAGFDPARIADCDTVTDSSKTYVFKVKPNSTIVDVKLVAPSKFFKLYFAKTATKADGAAVEATEATETLTVGKRTCTYAGASRPFVAALTWDKDVDLNLSILKFDRTKITTDKENAEIDQASWAKSQGSTVSHDVDHIGGFGPEWVGESTSATDLDSTCYKLMVHYYAGRETSVNAAVDVIHSIKVGDITQTEKYNTTKEFTKQDEWWMVGTYPPDCEEEPPVSTASASDCSEGYTAFFNGLAEKESGFKGFANFAGTQVDFQCKWEAGRRMPKNKSDDAPHYSNFGYTPGNSKGTTTSPRVQCNNQDRAYLGFWALRANSETKALDGSATKMPYVQFRARTKDQKIDLRSPNVFGKNKGATWKSGDLKFDTMTMEKGKPIVVKGCIKGDWDGADGNAASNVYAYFKLVY